MINFPNFERFGRANRQPPTQGSVIVALISFVVVVAVCVVFAIGSYSGTIEIKMTGYKIENNVAIIEIESKSSGVNTNELEYCVSGSLMQQDAKKKIQIRSQRNSSTNFGQETWYLIENNTIRVSLDDITTEITVIGTKSFEDILLVKNTTTGEWGKPSIWKKLSYSFKLF